MNNNRQDKLIKLINIISRRDMRDFDEMRRRPSSKKTDFSGYEIKSPAAADHQRQCRQRAQRGRCYKYRCYIT